MGTTGYTYADRLAFEPDEVILEVGSGDSTWHLAGLAPPVVTIDADPDAIARVAGLPAVEAHHGRAEDVLAGWGRPIGFAWLDGYDWPYSGNPAGYYAEQRARYEARGWPLSQDESRRSHLAVARLIAVHARVIAFDDTWRTHAYRPGPEGCAETVPPATLPAPRLAMDQPTGRPTCGLEADHPHHDDPGRGWNGKGGTAIPYLLASKFVVVECELGLVVLRQAESAAGPVSAPEPSEQQSLLRQPGGPQSEPWAALVGDEWDDEDSDDDEYDELPVSWFRPVVDVPTGGRL